MEILLEGNGLVNWPGAMCVEDPRTGEFVVEFALEEKTRADAEKKVDQFQELIEKSTEEASVRWKSSAPVTVRFGDSELAALLKAAAKEVAFVIFTETHRTVRGSRQGIDSPDGFGIREGTRTIERRQSVEARVSIALAMDHMTAESRRELFALFALLA